MLNNNVNMTFGSVVYKVNRLVGNKQKEDTISVRPWDDKPGQVYRTNQLIGESPLIAMLEESAKDYWKDTGLEATLTKAGIDLTPRQDGAADWRYNQVENDKVCQLLKDNHNADLAEKVKRAFDKQKEAEMAPRLLTLIAQALPTIEVKASDRNVVKQYLQYVPTLQGLLRGQTSGEMRESENIFTRTHKRIGSVVEGG